MLPRYREEKATQAAARLIQRKGGHLDVLSLMKLLYFVERRALVKWGRPITFDSYVSMPHGPVLSFTLNLVNFERDPANPGYWHRHISERRGNDVCLIGDAPNDQLSAAEEQLIDDVFAELGHLSRWQLRDLSHNLPEWRDPEGSSKPITIRDILLTEGLNSDEIQEVEDALAAEAAAEELS